MSGARDAAVETVQPAASDPAPAGNPSTPAPAPSSPEPSSSAPAAQQNTGESKETLLDAVLKVVPATTEDDVLGSKDKGDAPTSQPSAEAQAEADKAEESNDDETEDAPPADASPVVRKKVNKLLRQRRELRDEVAALRPHAEIGNNLAAFVQEHGISGDDLVTGLNAMAALSRGDHQVFYEIIAPYVRQTQEYLGVVLPPDLHQRVQQGQMSQEAAVEFARVRFDQQRAQQEVQTTREASATQHVQALQSNVQRAVTDFEARLQAHDPDYKAKADSVRRTAQAILYERGGTISSIQEALEITRAAYDEVNRQFRRFQPAPRATAPAPNGSMQQSHSARAAPKTLMEAALQGLENARRTG